MIKKTVLSLSACIILTLSFNLFGTQWYWSLNFANNAPSDWVNVDDQGTYYQVNAGGGFKQLGNHNDRGLGGKLVKDITVSGAVGTEDTICTIHYNFPSDSFYSNTAFAENSTEWDVPADGATDMIRITNNSNNIDRLQCIINRLDVKHSKDYMDNTIDDVMPTVTVTKL